ncbi:Elongator complex protein 4 [Galdieria sulphuraria]|uniref:Elongator complex protein 4 n=1 Tax=Galdieria sulphuraria TaxID=130081 RepID=M2X9K2_GALSU|nr:elongator complex protein 4 [Galdieria sulphuraria]EME26522.1 elongator complex protein 4 [Galdieria sulphuraria]GJD07195.1 Elongator complex protein 4 [Galdieria sulphuraria]|eukprot:XP_005703042.1 elongator complex protein 4 [Galdieria sulphuraria]
MEKNSFIRLASSQSSVAQLQIRKSGTRPSFYNKWPQTSTGFPELDKALGGGVPIGSVFVLLEDEPTRFYQSILNVFMAQGLAHKHTLALASADEEPSQVITNLPKRRNSLIAERNNKESNDASLKIAWRYAEQPSGSQIRGTSVSESLSGQVYHHTFDLTEQEDPKQLEKALISTFGDTCFTYDAMLLHMKEHILHSEDRGFMSRLVIRSFASHFWENATCQQLVIFLLYFRYIIRKSTEGCVGMISVARSSLEQYPFLKAALFHLGDIVLDLNSCQGQGTAELGLGNFHALANIHKYPRIGGVHLFRPPCSTFVLKRKRRSIEWQVAYSSPEEENENVRSFETGKTLQHHVDF